MRSIRGLSVLMGAAWLAVPLQASDQFGLERFGDWIVGCDNANSCVAIGLSPEGSETTSYLRIARDAGPGTRPIVMLAHEGTASSSGPIVLELDGGDVSFEAVPVPAPGTVGAIELDRTMGEDLIAALLPAKGLAVLIGTARSEIALEDLDAALLLIDERQGRTGTVDALVATGMRSAGTVPPAPALPRARTLGLVEQVPPGARPGGLPDADPLCGRQGDIVFDSADGSRLWGVCRSGGAYNLIYDMFAITGAGAVPLESAPLSASFYNEPGALLVDPVLSEDAGVLSSVDFGASSLDCGVTSGWAFDGERLMPIALSAMPVCRGVPSVDWPVLYRAIAVAE